MQELAAADGINLLNGSISSEDLAEEASMREAAARNGLATEGGGWWQAATVWRDRARGGGRQELGVGTDRCDNGERAELHVQHKGLPDAAGRAKSGDLRFNVHRAAGVAPAAERSDENKTDKCTRIPPVNKIKRKII